MLQCVRQFGGAAVYRHFQVWMPLTGAHGNDLRRFQPRWHGCCGTMRGHEDNHHNPLCRTETSSTDVGTQCLDVILTSVGLADEIVKEIKKKTYK